MTPLTTRQRAERSLRLTHAAKVGLLFGFTMWLWQVAAPFGLGEGSVSVESLLYGVFQGGGFFLFTYFWLYKRPREQGGIKEQLEALEVYEEFAEPLERPTREQD